VRKLSPARRLPDLAPNAEAIRSLRGLPRAKLVAAAAARGVAVHVRATREQLARALVTYAERAQAEVAYRETGTAFDSRSEAYPGIRRLVVQHGLGHLLDVGCGPGFFAEELVRADALGRDGWYHGVDISAAAVELAVARLASDPRFTFEVGDAERLGATRPGTDGIVLSFVVTYLDTAAVERLFERLARSYPSATVIVALTFRSAVDRHPELAVDDGRELRAARRFIAGDRAEAKPFWDVRRYDSYRSSFVARYRLIEEVVLKSTVQLMWVGRPRAARSRNRTT
jgi:SAM-dependent methyltransferase